MPEKGQEGGRCGAVHGKTGNYKTRKELGSLRLKKGARHPPERLTTNLKDALMMNLTNALEPGPAEVPRDGLREKGRRNWKLLFSIKSKKKGEGHRYLWGPSGLLVTEDDEEKNEKTALFIWRGN